MRDWIYLVLAIVVAGLILRHLRHRRQRPELAVQDNSTDQTVLRYTPPAFGSTDAAGGAAHYLPGGWQTGARPVSAAYYRDSRAGRMG